MNSIELQSQNIKIRIIKNLFIISMLLNFFLFSVLTKNELS